MGGLANVFSFDDYVKKDFLINDSLTRLINLDGSYVSLGYKLTQTDHEVFIETVKSCVRRCSFPDWGGDDEEEFSEKTKANIDKFLKLTASFIEKIPEVIPTNDGQLSLEWTGKIYESILRINQFGVNFIKTVRHTLTDGENEMQMMVSFTENDEKLKRTLYKMIKFANDEDSL